MTTLRGLAASAERADDDMADDKIPADIRKLTFEDALAELEEIVRGLETGSGDLDGAIEAYARGVQLKRYCEARLKDAQAKIDKIVKAAGGEIATEPLDDE
ncbi:MAG: exodeoxyribonuclease VII small subunit [Rhodospirillaceae bacterium]